MKKYALFVCVDYESQGGWNDYKGCFSSIKKAETFANNKYKNSMDGVCQIVDLEKLKIKKELNFTKPVEPNPHYKFEIKELCGFGPSINLK